MRVDKVKGTDPSQSTNVRDMAKQATKIVTLNGKPLPFKRNEAIVLYRSPYFLATVLGFIALMVVVRPNGIEYELSFLQRMAIWTMSILAYLLVLDAGARIATWLSGYSGLNRDVPTWVLHVLLVPLVTIPVHWLVETFVLPPGIDFSASIADILRNIFFAIITEAILVFAAFPRLQASSDDTLSPNAANRRLINAGRGSVFLDTLVLVKSVEHYLELETQTEKQMVRMRLTDFLTQVSEADGIQPHRSYWVPGHAIARMERTGGKVSIVLMNGRKVPVARSRMGNVKNWMAERDEVSASKDAGATGQPSGAQH